MVHGASVGRHVDAWQVVAKSPLHTRPLQQGVLAPHVLPIPPQAVPLVHTPPMQVALPQQSALVVHAAPAPWQRHTPIEQSIDPQQSAFVVQLSACSTQHTAAVGLARQEARASQHCAALEQAWCSAVHVAPTQVPAEHACPAAHAWPHAPQFAGSLETSVLPTQGPSVHAPASQVCVTTPHVPHADVVVVPGVHVLQPVSPVQLPDATQ